MVVTQPHEITPELLRLVKDFCRIDSDYELEDPVLTQMIGAAIEVIEGATNLSIFPKTIKVSGEGYEFKLPYGPHTAILSVTNSAGAILEPDRYEVRGTDFKSICFNSNGWHWFYPINGGDPIVEPMAPMVGMYPSFTVEFEAGYSPDNRPHGLTHLVCRLVDYYWTNRGSYTVGMPRDISTEVRRYSRQIIL